MCGFGSRRGVCLDNTFTSLKFSKMRENKEMKNSIHLLIERINLIWHMHRKALIGCSVTSWVVDQSMIRNRLNGPSTV